MCVESTEQYNDVTHALCVKQPHKASNIRHENEKQKRKKKENCRNKFHFHIQKQQQFACIFFCRESRNRKKEEELTVNVFVMLYFFHSASHVVSTKSSVLGISCVCHLIIHSLLHVLQDVKTEEKNLTGNGKMFYIQLGIKPCVR